jgi:hypothetical protein
MSNREEVEARLPRLGKTGHPGARPQPRQHAQPSREQLVRVALVSNIEEQAVVREVEYVVQGDGQLDDA